MKFFSIIALLVGISTGHVSADPIAVHGMLLFGKDATYVSHLPMYHKPHDYQVILKIGLKDLQHAATTVAYQEAKASGHELFTLVPQPMDLTTVISGARIQFKANIFQGHFEKGGIDLGPVMVKVDKIVLAKGISPSAIETSEYVVFGEQKEYFAAHLIGGKPNFDMILSVGQPYTSFEEMVCRTGTCLKVIKFPVPDSQLPLTLPYTLGGKPSENVPLGELGGTEADVLKILYDEDEDLLN